MRGVALAAFAAAAVVTYDEVHNNHRMPCPARYGGVFLVFGLVGLFPGTLGTAVAWALVIGLLVAQKSKPVQQITRAAATPKQQAA